jgi:hypothetical protein
MIRNKTAPALVLAMVCVAPAVQGCGGGLPVKFEAEGGKIAIVFDRDGSARFTQNVRIQHAANGTGLTLGPSQLPSLELEGNEAGAVAWRLREKSGTLELVNVTNSAVRFHLEKQGDLTLGPRPGVGEGRLFAGALSSSGAVSAHEGFVADGSPGWTGTFKAKDAAGRDVVVNVTKGIITSVK